MFTGIIESVGRIKRIEPVGGDMRLHVDVGSLDMKDVKLGDSIAVNGVCSAGFNTTVQPQASAGPSFQAAINNGKFQGII